MSPSTAFLCKLITLLLLSLNSSMLYAQEDTEENTLYTPTFRSGHTLSLLSSWERSTWHLNQTQSSSFGNISPISETRMGIALYFRYAYHINIVSNFGFFLGSTTGVIFPTTDYGNLKPGVGIAFPTALVGLSLNLKKQYRLFTGAEYGANWYPDMIVITDNGASRALAPVPDMLSFFGGLDYFYKKSLAFSFQSGYRITILRCTNNCSSTSFLNTLSISNQSVFVQLGLTWQVSEIRL
ncbi:hypothetical protein [Fluviispira vulneris]|uniref:hypothetical protein n=1 Tax=Fluviispira vulneris TaxID=2763012 RepID=UPI0016451D34|nr:hypothetical protein [Fluviispira vulneris]